MSHARDNVERIFPLLRAVCPAVPDTAIVKVEDEPTGTDDGVAHAYGYDPDSGLWRVSFDDAYEPSDENVGHEGGHLAHSAMARAGDHTLMERYWSRRRLPGTAKEWSEEAVRRGYPAHAGWVIHPTEKFAETLVAVAVGVTERGDDFGVPLTDAIRADMRAFYASLRPTSDVEERIAAFWRRVNTMAGTDRLTAFDLWQWARNVLERDPNTTIAVSDFKTTTAAMQAAFDRNRR